MTKVDILRNEIIEKVLCISNKEYLNAINQIVDNKEYNDNLIKLTTEQKYILDLSDNDIINNRVIKHEDLMKSKQAWLKGK
jgi:vacuolar-type H+-ATPase subunit E/Vma4